MHKTCYHLDDRPFASSMNRTLSIAHQASTEATLSAHTSFSNRDGALETWPSSTYVDDPPLSPDECGSCLSIWPAAYLQPSHIPFAVTARVLSHCCLRESRVALELQRNPGIIDESATGRDELVLRNEVTARSTEAGGAARNADQWVR